jgi:hypothetical protein
MSQAGDKIGKKFFFCFVGSHPTRTSTSRESAAKSYTFVVGVVLWFSFPHSTYGRAPGKQKTKNIDNA